MRMKHNESSDTCHTCFASNQTPGAFEAKEAIGYHMAYYGFGMPHLQTGNWRICVDSCLPEPAQILGLLLLGKGVN